MHAYTHTSILRVEKDYERNCVLVRRGLEGIDVKEKCVLLCDVPRFHYLPSMSLWHWRHYFERVTLRKSEDKCI